MESFRINGPRRNRLERIAATVAITLLAVVGALLGIAVFVALLGIAFVAGSVVAARVWWLKRRIARETGPAVKETPRQRQETVIEGEYHVVRDDDGTVP